MTDQAEQQTGSLKSRVLHSIRRIDAPAQLIIGIAAVVLGALLILAPINVHGIAIITGVGIALIGISTLVVAVREVEDHPNTFTLFGGVVLVILGATMALWPNAGAPGLAFLTGAGLILHGLISAIAAIVGRGDQRITAVIAAAATILVGVLAFSWPVLTLTIFRFALGGWLVFLGVQLVFSVATRRRKRNHTGDGHADRGRSARTQSDHTPTVFARWSKTIGATIAMVCAAALLWGTGVILGGVALPEPDEFYAAPATVPATPGQLVRFEPLTTGVPDGAQAWKILYTTTHPDNSPAISSGTVVAPLTRDGSALPLLTVAHGTTGVAPKCAPSMSSTPFADGAGTALSEMVTQHGWVAVTSDYIGLGTSGTHPYLIGEAEARNALDASLAAQQLTELTISTDTVVWGHSQGGQAALWIGQIANDYAPELTLKGVAAFAPAADLFGLAEADKNSAPGKTVSAYIASTWNEIYPELQLEQNLTPGSAGGVERIANLCFNGGDVLGAILTGSQVPNQIFPDRLLAGAFGDQLKAQTPTGPWPAPVMVAQGLADPLVLPAMQQDWVDARCTAGEQIDYRTFPGLGHVSLVAADSPLTPQIVQWTLDRWSDATPTPNCGGS